MMDYHGKEIITEKQNFCSLSKSLNMLFLIDLSLSLGCHLRNLEICLGQKWSVEKAKGLTPFLIKYLLNHILSYSSQKSYNKMKDIRH